MTKRTKMSDKQLAEIGRLMRLRGRKSFGALVRRALGHGEPDGGLSTIQAGKIIGFLRSEDGRCPARSVAA